MAEAGTSTNNVETLRNLLHVEIENKTKACSNVSFQCSATRLDGYKYCVQHILQDTEAPYTICAFTFPLSGHRCALAAPGQKHFSNYCFEHSRLVQLTKTRDLASKMQDPHSVEAQLGSLTHYVRMQKGADEDEEVDVEGISKDPLSEYRSKL